MVHGSSNGGKKKAKKAAKRKPVNLQPQYPKYAQGDFHMHSTCSDGKFRPSEVIAKAAANGVVYISLTDHDTMAGVSEAMDMGRSLGVFVLPGVEISAEEAGAENLHILGYFCPGTDSVALEAKLLAIRQARHKRGKEMLRKLAEMGIHLNWDRVLEIAGEAAPGRPHVAEALVEGGHVSNFREAFSRYLRNDGPAYAEGEHFPPEDAIQMIDQAGGVSVLAHPWCCKNPLAIVPTLAAAGIHGMEVYHDTGKIDLYGSLATESNLLRLGGSDFHGIDPMTEHAPGDIPLPRKHIDLFLELCKTKWRVPLASKVVEMCTSANEVEKSTIWTELFPLVKDTVDASYSDTVTLTHTVDGHYTDIVIAKCIIDNA
ncbi:hypothetical protein, variant 1 [Aphanomyces astaci]|uniref:Polymerase/histidinol phosphatase N-terminal domain-containing protein n=1 Tax=Aphanomyces astaci TaxID=112090 RepID=W4FUU7_APHAT|nr:hypothetical protein, variant 1 [Aphanomyces astaci]ETV70726.1 hypothetical protein, variant 1 [Aphanomyces astaci]|eukprot:XP_009839789.1 hypothetical protein, variant 1 [Aphanomyces astaci]